VAANPESSDRQNTVKEGTMFRIASFSGFLSGLISINKKFRDGIFWVREKE